MEQTVGNIDDRTAGLQIRYMCDDDIAEVVEIEKQNERMSWQADMFEASLVLGDTAFLVALLDGHVAGYCGMYISFEQAYITNVAVAPHARRQGIATRLLSGLVEEGERRGVSQFTLDVRKSNEHAIALYEQFGFQRVGERRRMYEKPVEDAWCMTWKKKDF